MPNHLQRSFVLAGVAGALVAFISLLVMVLLPRPLAPMDHFSILSGWANLSAPQLAAYSR